MLKPAGYRNYAVGKWHVTPPRRHGRPEAQLAAAPRVRPLLRHDPRRRQLLRPVVARPRQHDDLAVRRPGVQARARTTTPTPSPTTPSGSSATTRKDHADKPFFLYVAYTAAHWPMHALPEDIAKYKGKYDGGYEPIRKARFEKAAKLGLIDPKQTHDAARPATGTQGRGQDVGSRVHGSLRGDGRPHGPGRRQASSRS